METLLAIYIPLVVVGAVGGAVTVAIDPPWEVRNVPAEGRVVLVILASLFWPLFALAGVLWVLLAFSRGVGQVWRLAFPRRERRTEIPKAQARPR